MWGLKRWFFQRTWIDFKNTHKVSLSSLTPVLGGGVSNTFLFPHEASGMYMINMYTHKSKHPFA